MSPECEQPAAPVDEASERAAFEKKVAAGFVYILTRYEHNGEYHDPDTERAWRWWKAGRAHLRGEEK